MVRVRKPRGLHKRLALAVEAVTSGAYRIELLADVAIRLGSGPLVAPSAKTAIAQRARRSTSFLAHLKGARLGVDSYGY
jgi:hypothetical protein